MNMDDELRAALRREPAPPGFLAAVLAKAGASADTAKPRKPWLRRPFTLALAATVAAFAIVPAIVLEHQRREDARGLQAKRELLAALAITKDQLQQARKMVQRTTRNIQ